jgi:hypothetical protein
LTVTLAPGAPQPASLRISSFGHGQLGPARDVLLVNQSLPGTVALSGLDVAIGQDFHVLVDGLDAAGKLLDEGAARVHLDAHQRARANVMLTAGALPDPQLHGGCAGSAFFCDDFETGDVSRWTTTVQSDSSDLLTVDGTHVHSGANALHAAAAATSGPGESFVEYKWNGSASLAVRLWVYTATALSDVDIVLALYRGVHGFSIGGSPDGNWVMTEDQQASPDHHTTVPVHLRKWTCVELVLQGGRAQLFFDDSDTAAVDVAPVHPVSYNELHAGVEWAPSPRQAEVWIDDVAVGPSRLHCN